MLKILYRLDSSVTLTHHDPKDLGLICLVKKRKIHFRILSDFRIQSWIFLKKRTLRASMLLWSAWANASAYTSYINGWKSWRNKKIGRTRTHWTLAERQCQWRNEFGIVMSTSVSYQNSAKAWEMLVSAWEREIASWDTRSIGETLELWCRLTLGFYYWPHTECYVINICQQKTLFMQMWYSNL